VKLYLIATHSHYQRNKGVDNPRSSPPTAMSGNAAYMDGFFLRMWSTEPQPVWESRYGLQNPVATGDCR
jgi:hypothetical protein